MPRATTASQMMMAPAVIHQKSRAISSASRPAGASADCAPSQPSSNSVPAHKYEASSARCNLPVKRWDQRVELVIVFLPSQLDRAEKCRRDEDGPCNSCSP